MIVMMCPPPYARNAQIVEKNALRAGLAEKLNEREGTAAVIRRIKTRTRQMLSIEPKHPDINLPTVSVAPMSVVAEPARKANVPDTEFARIDSTPVTRDPQQQGHHCRMRKLKLPGSGAPVM